MICKNCKKDTKNKKFCSCSCAASYNNKFRKRTEESKKKTSDSILKTIQLLPLETKLLYIEKRVKARKESQKIKKEKQTKEKKRICTFCKNEFLYKGSRLCSDECYIKMKKYNAKGIKRQKYKGYIFDSMWEVKVAKFLDDKNIKWIQPKKAIHWVNNKGKEKRYYPDFYLPELKIYVDPKNNFCIEKQKEKLNIVTGKINLVYGSLKHIFNILNSLIAQMEEYLNTNQEVESSSLSR